MRVPTVIKSCPTRRILAFRRQPLDITLPVGDMTILPLGLTPVVRSEAQLYLSQRPSLLVLRGDLAALAAGIHACLGAQTPALAEDVLSLARLYADVTRRDVLRIRLEQVVTESCRKFHVDHLALRLLRSYVGPGVQWTRDGGEEVHDTPPEALVILAGTAHPEWSERCTVRHRSPPLSAAQRRAGGRLLLTIDETDLGPDDLGTEDGTGNPLSPEQRALWDLANWGDGRVRH